MTTFNYYIGKQYPKLKVYLDSALSDVSKELLSEAAKNYAEKLANDKISKYNQVMNEQSE